MTDYQPGLYVDRDGGFWDVRDTGAIAMFHDDDIEPEQPVGDVHAEYGPLVRMNSLPTEWVDTPAEPATADELQSIREAEALGFGGAEYREQMGDPPCGDDTPTSPRLDTGHNDARRREAAAPAVDTPAECNWHLGTCSYFAAGLSCDCGLVLTPAEPGGLGRLSRESHRARREAEAAPAVDGERDQLTGTVSELLKERLVGTLAEESGARSRWVKTWLMPLIDAYAEQRCRDMGHP